MCIRDRSYYDPRRQPERARERRNLVLKVLAEQGVVKPAEAVSYTHLRAHETVLDLVCRLLLEKKKARGDE